MNDSLGDRMKTYEDVTRFYLPRRTHTIIRLDGCHFHTYTKKLKKPFDFDLIEDLDSAVLETLPNIQNAKFAYIQSDEVSILLTDFAEINTESWFSNNIQKMASVSASILTANFNKERVTRQTEYALENNLDFTENDRWPLAIFDSRVFTIPQAIEVENYFIWRQQDCSRNSISMVAQSLYSHKELQNKNSKEMQELIFQKGVNWNDYPINLKRGRIIKKVQEKIDTSKLIWEANNKIKIKEPQEDIYRNRWVVDNEIPIFTQDREYLKNLIN